MDVAGPFCRTCGAERSRPGPGGDRREPCLRCGDLALEYRASGTVTAHATVSASYVVTGGNTAVNRRDSLAAAIDEADAAAASGRAGDAVSAIKRALEAIHELQDCADPKKRPTVEWTKSAWTPAQNDRWFALLGARNAAHHFSAPVVELHGDTTRPGHVLRWAPGISPVQSKSQRKAYAAMLAGQPVIPLLRGVAADISAAIR